MTDQAPMQAILPRAFAFTGRGVPSHIWDRFQVSLAEQMAADRARERRILSAMPSWRANPQSPKLETHDLPQQAKTIDPDDDLIFEMSKLCEPWTAARIREHLKSGHDRARSTIERLVKLGRITKIKAGRGNFYRAVKP